MITRQTMTACLVLTVLLAGEAMAQTGTGRRAFVASDGSDANPCTLASPCRSIAQALTRVTPGGEVVPLDSAGYGPFTVVDSVTLSTPPGVIASVTATSGFAITVTPADGATVILRGLSLTGLGTASNGINFTTTDPDTATLIVENVTISDFSLHGIRARADGLVVVNDSTISNVGNVGITLNDEPTTATASLVASVNRVSMLNTFNGIFIVGTNGVDATVKDSVAAGNRDSGFRADNASSMDLEHCVATDNNFGVVAINGAVVRVSNSTITANGTGLATSAGGTINSRGNNTLEDNGTDGTFDGAVVSANSARFWALPERSCPHGPSI